MYVLLSARSLSTDSFNDLVNGLVNSSNFFLACLVGKEKFSLIEKVVPFNLWAEERIFCLSLKKVILAMIGLFLSALNRPILCTRSNCAPVTAILSLPKIRLLSFRTLSNLLSHHLQVRKTAS